MKRLLLPGLLLALLAAQLVFRQWQLRPLPLTGPITGQALPPTHVRLLAEIKSQDLTELLTDTGSCSLLVIISSACPVCQRMRITWPRQYRAWADSIGAPMRAVWLSADSLEVLRTFYSGYDFRGIELARITTEPRAAMRRLGIYGTPTTYLIDRDGRLRIGVAGDQLPPTTSARTFCE